MKWFGNNKKKLEMIQAIRPTSKATLKIQCLFACKGDISEAEKLYNYFAKDMPELPDYDPVQPTWVDNTKEMATGLFGWIKDNQDTLAQGVNFIRDLMQRGPVANAPGAVAELPPINE